MGDWKVGIQRERERVMRKGAWPKVLSGLGGDVSEELHLDAAGGNCADGDVEEDDGVLGVWRSLMPIRDDACGGGNVGVVRCRHGDELWRSETIEKMSKGWMRTESASFWNWFSFTQQRNIKL